MNPRSGGVGVDGLQAVCSHVVFAESVTTPGLFEQAISRLHRSGQTARTINIYLLTALGTVAVKRRNDLLRKEHEANQVVGDTKTLLSELLGEEGIQGELS
jgi:SNF2 family DNA or RNA helicase